MIFTLTVHQWAVLAYIMSKLAIFRDLGLSMERAVGRVCYRAVTVRKCAVRHLNVSRTSAVIPH